MAGRTSIICWKIWTDKKNSIKYCEVQCTKNTCEDDICNFGDCCGYPWGETTAELVLT